MLTEKAKEVFKKEHPIRSLFPVSINFYRKWFESKGYFSQIPTIQKIKSLILI